MYSTRMMMKPVVLACTLALAACSSSDDAATTGTATTISGLVEAPGGQIAYFQNDKPMLLAVTDMLLPSAHADIIGLDAVRGATVELIRIDDDGNKVGDVLASTVTSITGNYNLALPTGVSLAGNLIVRITGNSGTSMSAMVVEQAVNINPISQYVLDKFVDDENLVLGDLALNEVVALQDKVEAFDLTATGDLSSILAQLDAEVGDLIVTEIAVLASTPDDGTAVDALAGTWNSIEFGMGMHDNEQQNYGTLGLDLISEGFAIAAGANAGEIDFSVGESTLIDAWTNFSINEQGVATIYHETSLTGDTENLVGFIDSDGNIILEFPFEEELETVDLQSDLDGPDFGWRWPPGSIAINNTGNNNTLVFISKEAGVRYETVDTDNDGVKDAVDPNAKSGDEASISLGLLLKQGDGMGNTSLDGDYGIISTVVDLSTMPAPLGSTDSTVGVINFSSGTASVATDAFDNIGYERSATIFTNVTLTDFGTTEGGFNFPYTVTSSGQLTLDTDNDGPSANDLQGWTNDDGSVIGLLNVKTTGTQVITAVTKEILVGVKLGTSAPSMANAVFKLYPVAFGAEETGLTELNTLGSLSSLTFNAEATAATADFTLRGIERATDIASVQAIVDPDEVPFDFTVNAIAANGAIDMSVSDAAETTYLEGFISADGSMMVLRLFEADDASGQKFRALGAVIGIRQ